MITPNVQAPDNVFSFLFPTVGEDAPDKVKRIEGAASTLIDESQLCVELHQRVEAASAPQCISDFLYPC